MGANLIRSVVAVALGTVVLGLIYPLLVTAVAQVAFPSAANGSQLRRDGEVVGSTLIGQDFRTPALDAQGEARIDADGNPVLVADPSYFQGRPSATGYSADLTYFNNLGPNSRELSEYFADRLDSYLELEGPFNPGLEAAGVPVDAVTTSASGVDPHISEANAQIQASRVAAQRGLPVARVLALVAEHTDGRFAGLFGEPGVNVLELNLSLDEEAP